MLIIIKSCDFFNSVSYSRFSNTKKSDVSQVVNIKTTMLVNYNKRLSYIFSKTLPIIQLSLNPDLIRFNKQLSALSEGIEASSPPEV